MRWVGEQEPAHFREYRPSFLACSIKRRLPGRNFAATPFQAGPVPIPNLKPPAAGMHAERDKQMEVLDR